MLAERAQAEAARRLQDGRQQYQDETGKLNELNQYYAEYASQIDSHRTGLTAQVMIGYRQFLQQLRQSIDVQQVRVRQVETLCDKLLINWQQLYHRHNSINDLIERLKVSESNELDKQLQRELDELSQAARSRSDQSAG